LEESLRRAVRKQKLARKDLRDKKRVHDVRVALRRCRSLAEGFSVLDLHPVWGHLDKVCKKQIKGISALRDAQVLEDWVRKLQLDGGSWGEKLEAALEKEERKARQEAAESLNGFPRKRMKHWLHSLPARVEMIPVGDSRLALLALERLAEVQESERQWRKTHSAAGWHKIRVAAKRFRYTLESFLPKQHAVSRRALKLLQNILGEGHDLDVLRDFLVQLARHEHLPRATRDRWLGRVARARLERAERYETAIAPAAKQHRSGQDRAAPGKALPRIWDRWRVRLARLGRVNPSDGVTPATSAATRA
jgi:CHAD domain-containing protein